MPRRQIGRSYVWFAMLLAAALVAWLLLSRGARTPPAPANETRRPAVVAAPADARRTPQDSQARAPAVNPGPAEGADSALPPQAPVPLTPGAAGADERQLVKIARGLSLGPDGELRVSSTPPGSVVGQLNLQPGDVIVTVNGRAVTTPEDFARLYHEQGSPTELTLLRDGQEIHRH